VAWLGKHPLRRPTCGIGPVLPGAQRSANADGHGPPLVVRCPCAPPHALGGPVVSCGAIEQPVPKWRTVCGVPLPAAGRSDTAGQTARAVTLMVVSRSFQARRQTAHSTPAFSRVSRSRSSRPSPPQGVRPRTVRREARPSAGPPFHRLGVRRLESAGHDALPTPQNPPVSNSSNHTVIGCKPWCARPRTATSAQNPGTRKASANHGRACDIADHRPYSRRRPCGDRPLVNPLKPGQ